MNSLRMEQGASFMKVLRHGGDTILSWRVPSNTFKLNTMKHTRQQNNFGYNERRFNRSVSAMQPKERRCMDRRWKLYQIGIQRGDDRYEQ